MRTFWIWINGITTMRQPLCRMWSIWTSSITISRTNISSSHIRENKCVKWRRPSIIKTNIRRRQCNRNIMCTLKTANHERSLHQPLHLCVSFISIFFCIVADGSTNVCFESIQNTHFRFCWLAGGMVSFCFQISADFHWFNGTTNGIYFCNPQNRTPATINKLLTPGFGSTIPYVCVRVGRSHSSVVNMNIRSLFNVVHGNKIIFSAPMSIFSRWVFFPSFLFVLFIHRILLKNSTLRSWLPVFSKTSNHFVAEFHSVHCLSVRRSWWIDATTFPFWRINFVRIIWIKSKNLNWTLCVTLQHNNKTIRRIRTYRGYTISNWTNCHICRPKWIGSAPKQDFK